MTVRIIGRVPAVPLRGDHVVIRAATLDDAEMLIRWHLDPDVMRFWDSDTFTHHEIVARLASMPPT